MPKQKIPTRIGQTAQSRQTSPPAEACIVTPKLGIFTASKKSPQSSANKKLCAARRVKQAKAEIYTDVEEVWRPPNLFEYGIY